MAELDAAGKLAVEHDNREWTLRLRGRERILATPYESGPGVPTVEPGERVTVVPKSRLDAALARIEELSA